MIDNPNILVNLNLVSAGLVHQGGDGASYGDAADGLEGSGSENWQVSGAPSTRMYISFSEDNILETICKFMMFAINIFSSVFCVIYYPFLARGCTFNFISKKIAA